MNRSHSRLFQVAECTAWPENLEPRMKFRVLETVLTADGPRTRVCDGVWETRDEAIADIEKREKGEDS